MENLETFLNEFSEDEEVSSGQPGWIFLSLPVFFLVWMLKADDPFGFRVAYASLAAIATIILVIIVAIWIPNDQMRKINRRRRFVKSETLIEKCKMVLKKIKENTSKDSDIKENGARAIATIQELIRVLKLKNSYQGIVEDNLVPGLFDYLIQLYTWYKDQVMAEILEKDVKVELYGDLTQKDELFRTWQASGTDPMRYLTSKFRTMNHMQSAGIYKEEKE